MAYTLEQFASDIRNALVADAGPPAKDEICRCVSRALKDPIFVQIYLKDRPSGANPREILYEDPQLGFCICGHVYDGPANGSPHDHGSSWAIYGQAIGITEMTDWKVIEKGDGDKPSLVEPIRTYSMQPGEGISTMLATRIRRGARSRCGSSASKERTSTMSSARASKSCILPPAHEPGASRKTARSCSSS